jgi:hypothetical protein
MIDILCYKCIGVENVHASYLMYEGKQLKFRADNDNLGLEWTTNSNCILQSLILDDREPDDAGLGDVWQLKFKPICLIVSPPDIKIYNYGLFCKDSPNNCYVVTSTFETRIIDLPMYLKSPSNISKKLDIRRCGFRVMPTSYFQQGSTITYRNPVLLI